MAQSKQVDFIVGQTERSLEQIESYLEDAEHTLEKIEFAFQPIQAKRRLAKEKPGQKEDNFEQIKDMFEQAEDAFQKVKHSLKKTEDESKKLGANNPVQIALELIKSRIKEFEARRTKAITRLGQVEDEPTLHDSMGFDRFARTIANIIIKSFDPEIKSNTTQLTIGIYGDWGSGKTSFLKIIESYLLNEKIHPIWFQAWRYYHQEEELWSALMQKILDDTRVDGPWYRKIWVKLRIWSNNNINWHDGLLEILSKIWRPVLPFIIAVVGGLMIYFSRNPMMASSSGHTAFSNFSSVPYLPTLIIILGSFVTAAGLVKPASDLFKALRGNLGIDFEKFKQKPAYRQKVAFWDQFSQEFETIVRLCGQGKPLVVIIDDLDRCLPEEALQVLEAIKNLLDVKGCIFLLGLDRKIVEKAIAVKYKEVIENQSNKEDSIEEKILPIQRFFYEDYVDKIFQLAITLPKLSTIESMKKFIKEVTYDEAVRNCIEVFSKGLSPNPRRIKRVLRTFLFVRDIAVDEVKQNAKAPDAEVNEEEDIVIELSRLAKLIVMQSEFPDVFGVITENPSLLIDLEEYYRKSISGSYGVIDSKDTSTSLNITDPAGIIASTIGSGTSTGSTDAEEAQITQVEMDASKREGINDRVGTINVGTVREDTTGLETNGKTINDAKAETEASKKNITLSGLADKYAAKYPKLPKVLIEGSSGENTYFSELNIDGIKHLIALIGALAEARPSKEELRIAGENLQEALLQAYLDHMSELLLQKNLLESPAGDVRSIARARTLTTFNQLDIKRKNLLLSFLRESRLVTSDVSIVTFEGVNLEKIDLAGVDLRFIDLKEANLGKANLREANLREANLGGAILRQADLSRANLSRANLDRADLSRANLSRANLREANLREAALDGASLRGTNLSGANLSGADLRGADLSGADLRGAALRGADLLDANLFAARIELEQLETTAKSLQGTMMPDGSRHP